MTKHVELNCPILALINQKSTLATGVDYITLFYAGAPKARVHCYGTHDPAEPSYWCRGTIFPGAETHQSNPDWLHGHHRHGEML